MSLLSRYRPRGNRASRPRGGILLDESWDRGSTSSPVLGAHVGSCVAIAVAYWPKGIFFRLTLDSATASQPSSPSHPDSPDLRSVLFLSTLIFSLFHTKHSCPAYSHQQLAQSFPSITSSSLFSNPLPSISQNGLQPCSCLPPGFVHGFLDRQGRSPCHARPGRQRLQAYHHW